MRLPSEAEWEYGCRAGTTTRFYFGDSLACLGNCQDCAAGVLPGNRTDYMWYCGNNSPDGTKPIGGKLPNAFGLHDVHGNIFEWCEDIYTRNYENTPVDGTANKRGSSIRVIRGGSWGRIALACRSACRSASGEASRGDLLGLRPADSCP